MSATMNSVNSRMDSMLAASSHEPSAAMNEISRAPGLPAIQTVVGTVSSKKLGSYQGFAEVLGVTPRGAARVENLLAVAEVDRTLIVEHRIEG